MITKIAKVSNEALRERWSTVVILALVLTVNRAVLDWGLVGVDTVAYIAKMFVTLLLSFLISLIIHVILHVISRPKPVKI